jgi:lipopolysaccharide transport system ATP-binding protein
MATITSLCQKAILLDSGKISLMGNTSDVVLSYYSKGEASPAAFNYVITNKIIGDRYANLLSGAVIDKNHNVCTEIDIREPFSIIMQYQISVTEKYRYIPNFHFFYSDGTYTFCSSPIEIDRLSPGIYEAECQVPGNYLNEGTFFVGLALTSLDSGMRVHFYDQNALSFHVKDPIDDVPTRNPAYSGPIPGVVRPLLRWSIRSLE